MDIAKESFFKASAITFVILLFGVLAGLQVDDLRSGYIENQVKESNLNTQSFVVTQSYLEDSSRDYCGVLKERIPEMSEQNAQIGQTLQSLGSRSISNKDKFSFLKRKYYVEQLRLFNVLETYKEKCNADTTLIFFFFDDSTESQRQGAVLTDYHTSYNNKSHVFSFNLNTEDSEVLKILKSDYSVESGPVTVINGNKTFRGFVSAGELDGYVENNSSTR